jgi:hypothetical protein
MLASDLGLGPAADLFCAAKDADPRQPRLGAAALKDVGETVARQRAAAAQPELGLLGVVVEPPLAEVAGEGQGGPRTEVNDPRPPALAEHGGHLVAKIDRVEGQGDDLAPAGASIDNSRNSTVSRRSASLAAAGPEQRPDARMRPPASPVARVGRQGLRLQRPDRLDADESLPEAHGHRA